MSTLSSSLINFLIAYPKVQRVQQENEDLFQVQDKARKLQEELTSSETRCADFETKVRNICT